MATTKPLTDQELAEFRRWQLATGNTNVSSAQLFKTSEGAVRKWLSGGGIRPVQRDLVLSTIRKSEPTQQPPPILDPELAQLYQQMQELKSRQPNALTLVRQQLEGLLLLFSSTPTQAKKELSAAVPDSRKREPPPKPETDVIRFPQMPVTGAQTPYWESAAAGAGGFMEAGEPLEVRIRGWERDNSIGLVRITGDSMEPSIQDGDLVVCRPLSSPLLLGPGQGVPMTVIRAEIPSGQMALISLDEGHSVTCKRLVYRGNDEKWGLWIFADNESAPGFPRLLKKTDTLAIYARVLGVADSEASE